MKKRIILTLLGLVALITVLAVVKIGQFGAMISQAKNYVPPPETVTTAVARVETWENTLTAVGSLKAVQGVTVSAELAGKVVKISFASGTAVKKGDLLVSQDTSSEEARLPGAIAQATLARTDLERSSGMVKDKIISRADHDNAVATASRHCPWPTTSAPPSPRKGSAPLSSVASAFARSTWGRCLEREIPSSPCSPSIPSTSSSAFPSSSCPVCASGFPCA